MYYYSSQDILVFYFDVKWVILLLKHNYMPVYDLLVSKAFDIHNYDMLLSITSSIQASEAMT